MMERNYPEQGFTPFPDNIAELYIEIGKKYHIRGDLAFAQALKETGYFQFYGSVQAFQNNFCGLGASGVENTGEEALNGVDPSRVYSIPGLHGLTFQTVADGVEAHIQHLYAYTTTDDLPAGCQLLDPRFGYVKRGVAEKMGGLRRPLGNTRRWLWGKHYQGLLVACDRVKARQSEALRKNGQGSKETDGIVEEEEFSRTALPLAVAC